MRDECNLICIQLFLFKSHLSWRIGCDGWNTLLHDSNAWPRTTWNFRDRLKHLAEELLLVVVFRH